MERKSIMCENSIEKRFVTEVERVGGWCLKLPAIHNAGLPDRLCLFPGGEVVFVELKAFGKKPRKIQKLKAMGFRVEVIDTTVGCKMLALEYDRK
jgi:hypothetical protein